MNETIARFLRLACHGKPKAAVRILKQHPQILAKSIHVACAAADVRALSRLLKADPKALTGDQPFLGGAPLVYACASHVHTLSPKHAKASLRCVRLLLDKGADANSFTLANPQDPHSRLSVLYRACVSNNVPVVKLLLARGADVNDGESFYHAAELNHQECMAVLLAHEAEIGAPHPHWKNTVLHFLMETQAPLAAIRWVLAHGADPNVPSGAQNETPLQSAAASGNLKRVALLLKFGADVGAARTDGRTAYALAIRNGHSDVAKRLKAAGAQTEVSPVDELLGACMRGSSSAVKKRLQADPTLAKSLTRDDVAMLTHAASLGRVEAARLLATLGFDLSWEHPEGGTALHWASWWGRPNVVRALLKLGAPLNVRDSTYGSSPIAWAAHGSSFCRRADDAYCTIVDLLWKAGAEYPFAINRWNEGPERMASPRVRRQLQKRRFVAPAA